jgi:putative addiction module component (TIGR02574 family)
MAMTWSASEFYEAALALPPSVRKDLAVRLLESIEVADQESVDEVWSTEIGSRVDDIVSGKVETIPGEQVLANLAARRAARQAARKG